MKTAIKEAFAENDLSHLVFSMFFFASDGANISSGFKSGHVTQFEESDLHWVAFVLCLSLSSKKLRELRQLHAVSKDIYSFKNNSVRP